MDNAIKLRICPIRRLFSVLETLKTKDDVAAIICTTEPVPKTKLSGIRYVHVSFSDITDSKRFDAFRTEKAQQIKRFVKISRTQRYYMYAVMVVNQEALS